MIKPRRHLFFCLNQRAELHPLGSCQKKGAVDVKQYMKKKVRESGLYDVFVTETKCLSMCEKGPILVIYPEGVWYHVPDKRAVEEIFDHHVMQNIIVKKYVI